MAAYSDRTFSATGLKAVTTSDTAVVAPTPVAIYVGGAGDVAVEMADGTTATFAGVAAGTTLPIQLRKVLATGTTATSILALYN